MTIEQKTRIATSRDRMKVASLAISMDLQAVREAAARIAAIVARVSK